MRRDWTTREIQTLESYAGKRSCAQIARALKRSQSSIRAQASKRGLSTRHFRWNLSWCIECTAWRSLKDKDGECLICVRKEQLKLGIQRFSEAYDRASQEVKAIYDANETQRTPRRLAPSPRMSDTHGMDSFHTDMEKTRHCVEMEAWELHRITSLINKEKMRLCRLRKHIGESPRERNTEESG